MTGNDIKTPNLQRRVPHLFPPKPQSQMAFPPPVPAPQSDVSMRDAGSGTPPLSAEQGM